MEIKLLKLQIESFKGIKSFAFETYGNDTTVIAANGVGKTTIYDACLWLLFGKDSKGKTDFDLRPLDKDNQPIEGLTLSVIAEVMIDGSAHIFRKEQPEKVSKKGDKSFPISHWINDVPKKMGEYKAYIADLVDEDVFKMLTDLQHFNSKLHWTDRRSVLLDIAGEIGTPKGFDELLGELNGRTVDEYKKVLSDQKKRYEKERDEIPPRIDELQRGLDDYVGNGDTTASVNRDTVKAKITELAAKRQAILDGEKKRQVKIEHVNELKAMQSQIEADLKSDTSGVETLLAEKTKLLSVLTDRRLAVNKAEAGQQTIKGQLLSKRETLNQQLATLKTIQTKYATANEKPVDATCYACGQELPESQCDQAEVERQKDLAEIVKTGSACKAAATAIKGEIETLQAQSETALETLQKAQIGLKEVEDYKQKRLPVIEESIAANKTPEPSQDAGWQTISKDIVKAEAEVGEPASKQLEAIESKQAEVTETLAKLDKTLAQADRIKQDTERIKALQKNMQGIAQSIANVEKQLDDIGQYRAAESALIETSVNKLFEHVEFTLFEEKLNGNIEPCCTCTLGGVPYAGMSTGETIYAGIDIVNVLSKHYDMSVCLFIDHRESMTLPIEAQSQVISLVAETGVNELTVTVKHEGELINA